MSSKSMVHSPPRHRDTFIFLQLPDLAQDGLQIHVEAVAVAQQLQQVPGAQGATRVVYELPGRRQAIRQNLKSFPLGKESMNPVQESESFVKVHFTFYLVRESTDSEIDTDSSI